MKEQQSVVVSNLFQELYEREFSRVMQEQLKYQYDSLKSDPNLGRAWDRIPPSTLAVVKPLKFIHDEVFVDLPRVWGGLPVTVKAFEFDKLPPATLYDGLTADECYERFCASQRELPTSTNYPPLTPSQRRVASERWSNALCTAVRVSKEKERNRVVCQQDDE